MSGKTVVITGASSGIGFVTARELAKLGADVVMLVRNAERGESARHAIASAAPGAAVSVVLCDLADLSSVREAATKVAARWPRIDVLSNNAGAIFGKRRLTPDGFEMTFQVNHLAHFLLTNLLLPNLLAASPSRVISVSSGAHLAARGGLPFDDLMLERGWRSFRAYANSKLANVLFAYELARRLETTNVTSNAVHPGLVATAFGQQETYVIGRFYTLTKRLQLTPDEGADTEIYLASSPDVAQVTGRYFYRRQPRDSSPASRDPEAARRLWDVSAKLVGLGDGGGG